MFRLRRRFRPDFAEQCRRYLVEETEAFLAGRLAGIVVDGEEPLPAWIEINWLAHTPVSELREAGQDCGGLAAPCNSWPWARTVLLRELLKRSPSDDATIGECQRGWLIPVELELMSPGGRWASPEDVVAVAMSWLEGADGHHSGNHDYHDNPGHDRDASDGPR